jgi:hypothetical protein
MMPKVEGLVSQLQFFVSMAVTDKRLRLGEYFRDLVFGSVRVCAVSLGYRVIREEAGFKKADVVVPTVRMLQIVSRGRKMGFAIA